MTNQKNSDDQEEQDDGMTREELEQKMEEHKEKRKEAYVKMGTVDNSQ